MKSTALRRLQLSFWAEDHLFAPFVAVPDDWPDNARLSSRAIDPLWEGDHTPSFSGIYAAVNAIRLATVGHCELGKGRTLDRIRLNGR